MAIKNIKLANFVIILQLELIVFWSVLLLYKKLFIFFFLWRIVSSSIFCSCLTFPIDLGKEKEKKRKTKMLKERVKERKKEGKKKESNMYRRKKWKKKKGKSIIFSAWNWQKQKSDWLTDKMFLEIKNLLYCVIWSLSRYLWIIINKLELSQFYWS